ncbi:MAG: glycosyltransferase family 4 protein [Candidatus Hydrogenedentales bacterium]
MKVLHLFSNHKWTGPAEPALNLCWALRAEGVETEFACARGPDITVNRIVTEARARGIEPILKFRLNKHRHPIFDWLDVLALRRYENKCWFDLIHCHLDNDHRIAANAERPFMPPNMMHFPKPIVRSSYEGEGITNYSRLRWPIQQTAFLIEPSRRALERDAGTFDLPPDRIAVVPGAVDTTRFDPNRPLPDARAKLGIPADAFVVGIVARMQTHRHYEDLWDAAARLMAEFAHVHVLVVGRGTKQETVGMAPVHEHGIEDRVHFTGFVSGDDYVAALAAMTVKVYLVPGSDATCRAVREALVMGVPCVVADRGMLSEIVDDGVTGIVFGTAAAQLHVALRGLVITPARVSEMQQYALGIARERYALAAQAAAVAVIYRRIVTLAQ